MKRLGGKIALVTGAGAGIGEAIARRFAEAGASVIVNDVSGPAAERVAKDVGGWSWTADVSDSAAVRRMLAEVEARHGRLDVLVNNAGVATHQSNPERLAKLAAVSLAQVQERTTQGRIESHLDATLETSDAEWRRILDIHLSGTFYCTREALRLMVRQAPGGASIVNMGSIMGTSGGAGDPAYCAAKAGILGLTRAHARELASRGIRVNAIAPGWIETAMTAPLSPMRPMLEMQTPLGRLGTPDEIAFAALYLASDEASFVTGQVLSPNGGWHMSQ